MRTPEHPILPLILDRWSPRAMSGEPISNEELMSLFEAARWAPSCFNNQSWRFVYAKRDTSHWQTFLDLLTDSNKSWCGRAAALVVVVSKTTFDHNGKPSRTHSFDTGAAWENLALQGSSMGFVVHGMAGFDHEKARQVLNIPDDHDVEAMIAIGRPGNKEDLNEKQQAQEFPSDRKKLSEIIFEGEFKTS